jgi:hypothetical protein
MALEAALSEAYALKLVTEPVMRERWSAIAVDPAPARFGRC